MLHFDTLEMFLMLHSATLELVSNAPFCDIKNRNFLMIFRRFYNISFFYNMRWKIIFSFEVTKNSQKMQS